MYNQQRYMYQPNQVILKGRPVSSLDEARASIIDFDGSIFFFPDLANNRIYTKQINVDGTASLNMYELKEIPIEKSKDYVTKEEFEQVISQLRQSFMPAPPQPIPDDAPVPAFNF